MNVSGITYQELLLNDGNRLETELAYLDDLNRLLPQLSDSARPLTYSGFYDILDTGTRLFVALSGGHIVGTVFLAKVRILVGWKYWIEDVVTDDNFRRRGISSRLMDMAEAAARTEGAKNVNLTSNPERVTARNQYEKRGYALRDTGVFRLTFSA